MFNIINRILKPDDIIVIIDLRSYIYYYCEINNKSKYIRNIIYFINDIYIWKS